MHARYNDYFITWKLTWGLIQGNGVQSRSQSPHVFWSAPEGTELWNNQQARSQSPRVFCF